MITNPRSKESTCTIYRVEAELVSSELREGLEDPIHRNERHLLQQLMHTMCELDFFQASLCLSQ